MGVAHLPKGYGQVSYSSSAWKIAEIPGIFLEEKKTANVNRAREGESPQVENHDE